VRSQSQDHQIVVRLQRTADGRKAMRRSLWKLGAGALECCGCGLEILESGLQIGRVCTSSMRSQLAVAAVCRACRRRLCRVRMCASVVEMCGSRVRVHGGVAGAGSEIQRAGSSTGGVHRTRHSRAHTCGRVPSVLMSPVMCESVRVRWRCAVAVCGCTGVLRVGLRNRGCGPPLW
jgi:hypothetical protein